MIGEPGVGKTAIVEGLAKQMAAGEVPPALLNKRILALDLAAVIAGTVYRGEFEGRMKQIIDETRQNPDVILFIDELHMIMGAGAASGSMDAANMLKPALARGDVRCIGATTPNEFKKHIETDAALERRFQTVQVDEPDIQASIQILVGLCSYYEDYHNVTITNEALEASVRLSARHITDRFLPDKAIDLVDEAAASMRVHTITTENDGKHIRDIESQITEVQEAKRQAIVEELFEEAIDLKEKERLLKNKLKDSKTTHVSQEPIGVIDVKEIAAVISRSTGIPISDLVEEERKRLKDLANILKASIVGQSSVVESVAASILRAKTGVTHPDRPQASFLFVGPSGVGKTELARKLSKELFQNREALIQLDMSEYSEGFTASKLIGSPAGYIGYREGAKLTDQVKSKPYAVVLFDEIEKAHKDVQNLLLQILETGELSDATGKKISFKNTIIIMTSNVGLERYNGSALGFGGDETTKAFSANVHKDLEERFRPELLNRIDQILLFEQLTQDALTKIAILQLTDVIGRLKEQNVELKFTNEIPSHIAERALSGKVGARAIRRFIQDTIETAIAQKLLSERKPKQLFIKPKGKSIVVTTR